MASNNESPLSSGVSTGESVTPSNHHSLALKRVLLVDDEQSILWLFKEALAEIPNCQLVATTSSYQALQFFETEPFDLMITDYRIPGLDGLTLASLVRQVHPQAVIVMLTAYGSNWLAAQAADAGIRYVLSKPIKLNEMRRLVADLLNDSPSGKA